MSGQPPPLQGLYAIMDPSVAAGELLPLVESALRGGARLVQYRAKGRDTTRRLQESRALQRLCESFNRPLIINDDIDLALAVGAAGVHLGRDDTPLGEARERLGPDALIGISCYDSLGRAREAQSAGASYVAFGRFFPSRVKPDAVQATPGLLVEAKRQLKIPLVAIGGITPENGAALVTAGADMLAVIAGLFRQPDVAAVARQFATLFNTLPAGHPRTGEDPSI